MPHFASKNVEILLYAALAKADANLSRNGFGKLYQDIASNFEDVVISKRYIDERIYQQLKKARKDKRQEISLKNEYLDELASYIGYEGYLHFEKRLEETQNLLDPEIFSGLADKTSIPIIYDQNQPNDIERKCTQFLFSGQNVQLHYVPNSLKLSTSDEVFCDIEDETVTVIFVNRSLSSDNPALLKDLDLQFEETPNIIPIWSESSKELKSPYNWLTINDFALLIQFIFIESNILDTQGSEEHKIQQSKITNIRDSGTVNLGKIGKITAEYISSRDMHINRSDSKRKKNKD